MCSATPFNRYTSNVLRSTDFTDNGSASAKTDDGIASAKLTTGVKALHKARSLNRALYALIRRQIALHKSKMASVPQGATKCAQCKKSAAYAA